jgi:hypothetical protein
MNEMPAKRFVPARVYHYASGGMNERVPSPFK